MYNKEAADDSESSAESDSSHHGRFLPGTKVANRYRIVSLLGRGGMGQVYRADDLKLGHTVALKFLPQELADDAKRLEYFHREVRLSRQIAHPNVCRVYDIGEIDGQHFLSMEYIDGEDLGVLHWCGLALGCMMVYLAPRARPSAWSRAALDNVSGGLAGDA